MATRARAPKGTGSVFPVKRDGVIVSYRATEELGKAAYRRVRISAEGKSPAEAREKLFLKKVKRQVELGLIPASAMPAGTRREKTLSEWLDIWLMRKTNELSAGTYKQYESAVRLYMKPQLGTTMLSLVSPALVGNYINNYLPSLMKADGTRVVGPTRVRAHYFILRAALDEAVRTGEIPTNPVNIAFAKSPSRTTQNKLRSMELSAAKDTAPQMLLAHLHTEDDAARWMLALFAMRQNEVLGLTLDALDFTPGQENIHIFQQLKQNSFEHGCGTLADGSWACGEQAANCRFRSGNNNYYLSTELKTKDSDRRIPMVEPLKSALLAQVERQKRLSQSPTWNPETGLENLLFTTEDGKPISGQSDRRRWKKVLRDSGVSYQLRVHDARHIAVSLLVSNKLISTPDELRKLTGWSPGTAAAMLANYSHQDDRIVREPLTKFGALLTSK